MTMKLHRVLKSSMLISIAIVGFSILAMARGVDAKKIFERPFITRASVSADWNTKSPGKTLALRYTKESEILTVAIGGRPGKEMIKQFQESQLKDRTIILAIDFLFWDSTLPDSSASHEALEKLLGYASNLKIPIVLGEIPELLPGRQMMRRDLNNHIKKACSAYGDCYLMPFDAIQQQALKDGFLEIIWKKYKLAELVSDGLHLSAPATAYLADRMLDLLNQKTK